MDRESLLYLINNIVIGLLGLYRMSSSSRNINSLGKVNFIKLNKTNKLNESNKSKLYHLIFLCFNVYQFIISLKCLFSITLRLRNDIYFEQIMQVSQQ